jgi:enoyl-CoA hydratase/carnithine racemase
MVLTGVGRGFCSGADMKRDTPDDMKGENFVGNRHVLDGPDAAREHFIHGFTKLHRDISQVRKPTIAMINGPAVGSGMDMALHCDIRIGCENTRFIGYQQLGQIMENGGSYYFPKMVGLGRALEFAYVGHLDAKRAYEWGLLNHLVESEKLEETTRELCARMVRTPPLVQWISKRILRAAADSSLETTMILTSNAGGILSGSADAEEARRAFLEKRPATFQGR